MLPTLGTAERFRKAKAFVFALLTAGEDEIGFALNTYQHLVFHLWMPLSVAEVDDRVQ